VVYEEADLIKRAIRDMYAKDIDEILVDGEEGYRVAKDFMRMLMPSHAKKVQPYRDRIPLLHRYQVEQQLDSMHSNVVQLKSGGYLVFAQTEALVAVDVNSGRSTKERNIEETAQKTNLEAADEVGRQLRLRDLSGLVVIDFIDMDENRNNRAVERRIKEALKDDRARIQVGRISSFGLMELSRQRLRPSLFEASTKICEICSGTGFVRTTESTSLHVLRTIEEEGIRGRAARLTVHAPANVALYLLNQKRDHLTEIQQRYGMQVYILGDEALVAPDCRVTIDQTRTAEEVEEIEIERRRTAALAVAIDDDDDDALAADEAAAEAAKADQTGVEDDGEEAQEIRPRRRRRPRHRGADTKNERNGNDLEADEADAALNGADDETKTDEAASGEAEVDSEDKTRRRRRGRRGGRRRRAGGEPADQAGAIGDTENTANDGNGASEAVISGEISPSLIERAGRMTNNSYDPVAPIEPAAPIGFTASGRLLDEAPAAEINGDASDNGAASDDVAAISAAAMPEPFVVPDATAEAAPVEAVVVEADAADDASKPKRRGWWQRGRLF